MVWAVIALFCYLFFPVPALAIDEVPAVVDAEGVTDAEEAPDSDTSNPDRPVSDVDQPELQPDAADNVAVSLPEDIVTYSPTGEMLSTTKEPELLAAPLAVTSPYASVTSNSYSEIAALMLGKLKWSDNYVFWRSGQYAYTLAYGDIELSAQGRFTSDSATLVSFVLDQGYSGTYHMQRSVESLALDSGTFIVFSNLGDYPVLDYDSQKIKHMVFALSVMVCMSLIRPLFDFVSRMGVRVHGSHES